MDQTASPPPSAERRSPTPAAARKREAIYHLKTAMAEDRVVLHYQPVVTAREGWIDTVEALLRWRAPGDETQELTDLILAAERSPVIFRLEHWTLRRAFHEAAGWLPAGGTQPRLNVNLSAREFVRPRLAARVLRQLRSAGLEPRAVALEITETSAIEAFDTVAGHIDRFVEAGVEVWLDDFGTGHSSLDWLSHLPIHGVKIAGTFVERILTEERCRTIVTRVIEMAHDLGLRVAAEGVEQAGQRDLLVEIGCDLLQGFLLHPPMPAAELPAALAATGLGRR